jgi:hypothetical protein
MTPEELAQRGQMDQSERKDKTSKRKRTDQTEGTDGSPEQPRPELTKQEREKLLLAERQSVVKTRLKEAFDKTFSDPDDTKHGAVDDSVRNTINTDADIELAKQMSALSKEFEMKDGPCYMHQERLEGKGRHPNPIYCHRYMVVNPGALGEFKPDRVNCNRVNAKSLGALLDSLNQMLLTDDETRAGGIPGYKCRCCSRSLYHSLFRDQDTCACLRCLSVLYCSEACRAANAREHAFSCFLHPGWECEEGTRRRLEKLGATGATTQQLSEVKTPTITAPEMSALGALNILQDRMVDDHIIVKDDEDEAGNTGQDGCTAGGAGDADEAAEGDITKTATGGDSNVDARS